MDEFPSGRILSPTGSLGKYSFHMEGFTADAPIFPEWLKRQLQRRGWTSAELSRRTDLPSGTISRWLNGQRTPRDSEHIRRLAEAFSVHQDEILEQLDMRDGSADRMSLAVRRLQPLIDSIQWNEGTYKLVESTLENLREMQSGALKEPKADWEDGEDLL